MIFLVSDTHFNHQKLTEIGVRPEGFTETIITNWRIIVAPTDTVIHLGDVILGRNSELPDIMAKLPGTKILCLGNHDGHAGWYEKRGFAIAVKHFQRGDILYSHEPTIPLPTGIRYNVHGHLHLHNHHEYQEQEYYVTHRDQYILIEIETTLAPIALSELQKLKGMAT